MFENIALETRFSPDGIIFGTTETLIICFFAVLLLLGAVALYKK